VLGGAGAGARVGAAAVLVRFVATFFGLPIIARSLFLFDGAITLLI